MNQPIDPALRLHPGQEALTPAQEAEAKRFAAERIDKQLATEPVDELEAEALLKQAYVVAQLLPPTRIHWVDGPLQLLQILAARTPQHKGAEGHENPTEDIVHERAWASVGKSIEKLGYISGWNDGARHITTNVGEPVGYRVNENLWGRVNESMRDNIGEHVAVKASDHLWDSVGEAVWDGVGHDVFECIVESMWDDAWASKSQSEWERIYRTIHVSIWHSVGAYKYAGMLAFYRFFDAYLAPNALQSLAHFNELVSGYWLGSETAIIVRRPRMFTRDEDGRLHGATGKCLEYRDGWGFYAWHGVRVSERVILAPETLTRADFLHEEDEQVQRVIQERMGKRFVPELGGVVIDVGPRGALYAVRVSEDNPEDLAHYVQVQDTSASHQYFVRVPTTIQTVGEAVAWAVQPKAEE